MRNGVELDEEVKKTLPYVSVWNPFPISFPILTDSCYQAEQRDVTAEQHDLIDSLSLQKERLTSRQICDKVIELRRNEDGVVYHTGLAAAEIANRISNARSELRCGDVLAQIEETYGGSIKSDTFLQETRSFNDKDGLGRVMMFSCRQLMRRLFSPKVCFNCPIFAHIQ